MKYGFMIWLSLLLWSQNALAQDRCNTYQLPQLQQWTLPIGGSISYLDTGKGKPILLIHGLGGNSGHWRHNVPGLVQAGCRVIAVNLPGYSGNTTADIPAEEQLSYYAKSIDALAKKLQLKNVLVAGHSMGGQTAMVLALQQPTWLDRLVLAAPAGIERFTDQEATILKQYATAAYFAGQQLPVIQNNIKANFFQPPADISLLVEERMAIRDCAWFNTYCLAAQAGVTGMLAAYRLAEMKQLQIPVLVLLGAEDGLIPNKLLHPTLSRDQLIQTAKTAMPATQVISIQKAGHMLQWEQPEAFNQSLLSFFHQ